MRRFDLFKRHCQLKPSEQQTGGSTDIIIRPFFSDFSYKNKKQAKTSAINGLSLAKIFDF